MKRSAFLFIVPLILLYWIITAPLYAQEVHVSTSVFTSPGLEVSINGSVRNKGFIQNQGQLSLTGNWINQSIYQGLGSIVLAGVNQAVANNGQRIHYLIIDGGGTKNINGKLIIESQIDFENGIVIVDDADTLLLNDQVEINNASSHSYVEGALTASGTGYHFFPIGKSGHYHPIIMQDIKGLSPTIEMEVFQNLPSVQTSVPTELFQDIYWKRTTIDGSFESSPVSLTYSIPSTIPTDQLIIAHGDDLQSEFLIQGGLNSHLVSGNQQISTNQPIKGSIIAVGHYKSDAPRSFYFSTTLSPNASNPENRAIRVFGDQLNSNGFLFEVYNRWGNLIFKNQSLIEMNTTGWDGRQDGNILTSGVYPYSLKYQDSSGKTQYRTGFITIIN